MELTTPTTEVILAQCQKSTLVKTRIQSAIYFLESESIKVKKNVIFQANDLLYKTNYQIL